MKNILVLAVLALCLLSSFLLADDKNKSSKRANKVVVEKEYVDMEKLCCDKERVKKAEEEYVRAEKALQKTLDDIYKKYNTNKYFITALKKSQEVWKAYFVAELELLFPGDNKLVLYGSNIQFCEPVESAKLTWTRVKYLKKWLGPIRDEECDGSIGMYELDELEVDTTD